MADFGLYHPRKTGNTSSWVPSKNPQIPADYNEDDGVLVDISADGSTTFRYGIWDAQISDWEFTFDFLTQAEKDDFETFRLAVKTDEFEMEDPATGELHLVTFSPEGYRRRWEYLNAPPEPWSVTLRFREVLS